MTGPMVAREGRPAGVRGAPVALLAFVALVALGAACTDLPTNASEPFALTFEKLPFPAVVVGQPMRDATGTQAPLQATVYNGAGDLIPDAAVTFRVLDPGATVDADGLLTGVRLANGNLATGVRVIAEVGGIQSLPLRFDVVPPPDSLHLPLTTAVAAEWSIPSTAEDRSAPLEAQLLHRPAVAEGAPAATPVAVRSWLVRYALEVDGVPQASDSTALFWFVDDGGRRSPVDTTDAQGTAARRLRINGDEAAALASIESVVVIVTAEGAGTAARNPGRIVVPIRRRTATP